MRITDNDRKFGPFIYGPAGSKTWAIHFNTSMYEEDGDTHHNHLWIQLFGWIVVVMLPFWVQPHRTKIYPDSWDQATIDRLGRNWYWDCDNRRWGFSLNDNYVQFFYGRQSNDSTNEQRKGWFLPWKEWRFVRMSTYHYDGTHHFTEGDSKGKDWKTLYEQKEKTKEGIVKQHVKVKDYDGAEVTASLHITEREWVRGVKSFAWLKYFFKPLIRRSLEIEFSQGVGDRKGSWKGGLMATSIDILPEETSLDAFKRYCDTESVSRHRDHRLKIVCVISPTNI